MASIDIPSANAVFVHVPKTAGYSITTALRTSLPDTADHPTRDMRRPHGAAEYLARRIGRRTFERRWSFCFLRDPWDWTVSGYIHVTRNQPAYGDAAPDFADFVRGGWRTGLAHNPHPRKYRDASVHVAYHTQITQSGHLSLGLRKRWAPIAFFAQFERLQADWERICDRLGTPIELPHQNRSDRDAYTDYYTDETREIVRRRNADLIERFDYRFGG